MIAVAPVLMHHPLHLEAIQAEIDFMMLASYQSHSDTTVKFLVKSLQTFYHLIQVFERQRLGSDGHQRGHFGIPKCHALTHYAHWRKRMETLDNVNTALSETLHKTVKAAFRHSNKVDFFTQMCFWDDQQLLVEMREATFRYLAVGEQGPWRSKIQGSFELLGKV